MESSKPPRVFISYAWESEDHKNWVRYLAERLCQNGIEARLDQWFVEPGESFTVFMEQEVETADFVVVVCTPTYARKSNKRLGGVGYEQQIVSGELMTGTARRKFIPILRSGDYEPGPNCAIPTHFRGIAWIEFRDDAAFEKSLEDLIRVIFSKPRFAPPPLGARPTLETISTTILDRIRRTQASENRILLDLDKDKSVVEKTETTKPGETAAEISDNAASLAGVETGDTVNSDQSNPLNLYINRESAYVEKTQDSQLDNSVSPKLVQLPISASTSPPLTPDEEKSDIVKAEFLGESNAGAKVKNAVWPSSSQIDFATRLSKSKRFEEFIQQGNEHANKGQYDRAIAAFGQAIELRPDEALAYNNRGDAYSDQGNIELALADYDKAIELQPGDARAYYNRGNIYFDQGRFDLALADYDKAIELQPGDALAYYNRGDVYFDQGNLGLALTDYDKAIELRPNDVDAYNNRGNVYHIQGKLDLALVDYNKAIELQPNEARAYNNRGNVYRDQKKLDLALADYDKAIELKPHEALAYNNRGDAYSDQGNIELALADYNKAIELQPGDARAYYNRGNIYYDREDLDLALANYDKSIELQPNEARAYNNRGNVYRDQNELDLALADYDKAIELRPDNVDAYYNRGLTHRDKGDNIRAIADFRKSLELSTNLIDREDALKQLQSLGVN